MWFDVSKEGLRKLQGSKPKSFILYELVQNAWDEEGCTEVQIEIQSEEKPGKKLHPVMIRVTDNSPIGFHDLSHAWTLFAESYKKGIPDKRGRFNAGEKYVLSLCDSATILSTSGGVRFDETGRHRIHQKTQSGSVVECHLHLNRVDIRELRFAVDKLLPPRKIRTFYNGKELNSPLFADVITAKLPTILEDEEGFLCATVRECDIEVFALRSGETATIYEMGIPVVETRDKWHYNVRQKVPLNSDRDNVTPAFLRTLRVHVLNELWEQITKEDANQDWVREATSDKRCSNEAIDRVASLRFGEKRVSYDPSDPEANCAATAAGYTVVHGGMASATEWKNMRRALAITPAGHVFPRKINFSGTAEQAIENEHMKAIRRYVMFLAKQLMGEEVRVHFLNASGCDATYGNQTLTFYVKSLGAKWFNLRKNNMEIDRLVLHELAHEYGHHLEDKYHDALCRFGARIKALALGNPWMFAMDRFYNNEEINNKKTKETV